MKIGKAEITGGPNTNFWAVTLCVAALGPKAFGLWVVFWAAVFVAVILYLNWWRSSAEDAP